MTKPKPFCIKCGIDDWCKTADKRCVFVVLFSDHEKAQESLNSKLRYAEIKIATLIQEHKNWKLLCKQKLKEWLIKNKFRHTLSSGEYDKVIDEVFEK